MTPRTGEKRGEKQLDCHSLIIFLEFVIFLLKSEKKKKKKKQKKSRWMKNENKYGDKCLALSIFAARIPISTSQEPYTTSDGAPATSGPSGGSPAGAQPPPPFPHGTLLNCFR